MIWLPVTWFHPLRLDKIWYHNSIPFPTTRLAVKIILCIWWHMEQALRRKELKRKSLSSKCTQNGNGEIQMCLFFVSGETSQCLSVINCQMVHIVFFPILGVFPFSGGNGKIPKWSYIDLYHFTITILQVSFNIPERTHCLCPIEQMFKDPAIYIPSIPGREGEPFFI